MKTLTKTLVKGDVIEIRGIEYVYIRRIDSQDIQVGNRSTGKLERIYFPSK